MYPSTTMRAVKQRNQEIVAEVSRTRQARQAANAQQHRSGPSRGWSRHEIVSLFVTLLGTAGIFGWAR